jgi:hypothetical protein
MKPILRKKSPRAPSMPLDEAIARVQKAYDKQQLRAAPTDEVAQNLGYKGANNGSALSALASLRYYGLLERPRDGHLAVSKDFERFKLAPDALQRQALLAGFLKQPQLYGQLLEKYEGGLPSVADLRAEMIQRGFNAAAAEGAMATFRRSVEFVGLPASKVALPANVASVAASLRLDGRSSGEAVAPNEPPAPSLIAAAVSVSVAADENSDRIPVRLPGNRRAWLVIPDPFFEADKARLKAQIDLLLTQDEEGGL